MPIEDPSNRRRSAADITGGSETDAAGRNWGETVVVVVLATAAVLAVSFLAVLMELA